MPSRKRFIHIFAKWRVTHHLVRRLERNVDVKGATLISCAHIRAENDTLEREILFAIIEPWFDRAETKNHQPENGIDKGCDARPVFYLWQAHLFGTFAGASGTNGDRHPWRSCTDQACGSPLLLRWLTPAR